MKILDKIKNAFFEEEYIEVKTKKGNDVEDDSDEKKDKPIAKKVILSKPRHERISNNEVKKQEVDNSSLTDMKSIKDEKIEKEDYVNNDFKIIEDNDFNNQNVSINESKFEDERYNNVSYSSYEYETNSVKLEENRVIYQTDVPKEKAPYGIDESNKKLVEEYGRAYEKREERSGFKPSPIISPIYGVLDKNYKKEDVVQKRDVKMSNYSRESQNVDDIRNKAYGSIEENKYEKKKSDYDNSIEPMYEDEEDDDLLVDLSKEDNKPLIKEVTMGDALEYFQDLGLEYNVDYKDASKEKATGRRVKSHYDDEPEIFAIQEEVVTDRSNSIKIEEDKKTSKELNVDKNDNLFDLIENMYQEEK